MSKIKRSKTSTFLMELIFNLFLFCFLCSCGLLLFIKSYNIAKDSTTLHHAVSMCSSIASIYESGEENFDDLSEFYPRAWVSQNHLYIYFDENFVHCTKADASHYVIATLGDHILDISFFSMEHELFYSLVVRKHNPLLLGEIVEVDHEEN